MPLLDLPELTRVPRREALNAAATVVANQFRLAKSRREENVIDPIDAQFGWARFVKVPWQFMSVPKVLFHTAWAGLRGDLYKTNGVDALVYAHDSKHRGLVSRVAINTAKTATLAATFALNAAGISAALSSFPVASPLGATAVYTAAALGIFGVEAGVMFSRTPFSANGVRAISKTWRDERDSGADKLELRLVSARDDFDSVRAVLIARRAAASIDKALLAEARFSRDGQSLELAGLDPLKSTGPSPYVSYTSPPTPPPAVQERPSSGITFL